MADSTKRGFRYDGYASCTANINCKLESQNIPVFLLRNSRHRSTKGEVRPEAQEGRTREGHVGCFSPVPELGKVVSIRRLPRAVSAFGRVENIGV